MARLIVKWRYIKPGLPKHGQHLVKYVATREGVEKCDESWKVETATRQQTRLVNNLLKDFPSVKEAYEYEDYTKEQSKYKASRLIDKAIDENIDLIGKKENYVGYIAKRPRVEQQGKHGLFTQEDIPIDLEAISRKVAKHKGLVWTTIISLRREDAARLGYDNARAWKELLRSQTDVLAKAMGINVEELEWYAAFHNEAGHPHIHLVSFSNGKKPYMTRRGLQRMKSQYVKEIFKQDLYQTYEVQTKYRDELRRYAKARAKAIVRQIQSGGYNNQTVEMLLLRLKEELKTYLQLNKRRYKALVNQCLIALIYKGFLVCLCGKCKNINIRGPPC